MGSGGYHHFHWCYRGRGVFVSVLQNIHNMLHTNLKFNMVQDSVNSTYDIIKL